MLIIYGNFVKIPSHSLFCAKIISELDIFSLKSEMCKYYSNSDKQL